MKISQQLTLCAMVAFAQIASAVTIDSAYLIGTVDKGSPADPSLEVARLNYLVDEYNGSTSNGALPTPAFDATNDYLLAVGSSVAPTPLPSAITYTAQTTAGAVTTFSLNLSSTSYDYLLVKWAGIASYYYIGGLGGTETVVNDLVFNNKGVAQNQSHYVLFNGTSRTTRVPDGGTTVALFGLAILGLGGTRRLLRTRN